LLQLIVIIAIVSSKDKMKAIKSSMLSYFSSTSGRILDNITYVQRMQRRPSIYPDPLVDVTYLYWITLNKEDISPGYFTTCKSHKITMEIQEVMFTPLLEDKSFWDFVADQSKGLVMSPSHILMQDIIKLGIPPKYRSRMWQTMSGSHTKPMNFLAYSDLFLLETMQAETQAQISQDVNRTFPGLGKPKFIDKLTRVLTAYSLRNPRLGYCQSMNFLAGTLLIFMEEEHAFWMLVYFAEELLHNYYVTSMAGFHIDARVFEKLLEIHLPELHHHFVNCNMSVTILTAPWFLCLFTNDLPNETCYWVWDNLLLDGVSVLFEVGLAILKMIQYELLEIFEQADLIQTVRKFSATIYDPVQLRRNWFCLEKKRVLKIRHQIRKQVEAEANRAILNKMFSELELSTHFEPEELEILWKQYTTIDPFLSYGGASTGLDTTQFSRLIRGTFTEWECDKRLTEWLFSISDVNHNGLVEFAEIAMLFSVICRGTFKQIVNFNFHLFDVDAKGGIDKRDLSSMLMSIYSIFRTDDNFFSLVNSFVNVIFDTCRKNSRGLIPVQNFEYVVSIQPQIMQRFTARNPNIKYEQKETYYYWMFDPERNRRQQREREHREVIRLGYAKDYNFGVLSPKPAPLIVQSLFGTNGARGLCLS